MPSTKKKVGTRSVLGSPFSPPETCPKLNKILRESLKGVWPPKAPSSKALIRKDPEFLKSLSKTERAAKLKELKSRSSITIHPDRKFVKVGLKSCLRSLQDLRVLFLDKTNPNIESISSTLFPLRKPSFSIFLVDKLSKICEDILGFHSLALAFCHPIKKPSNRFHAVFIYIDSLTQKEAEKEGLNEPQPPPRKKIKIEKETPPSESKEDFGSDFISFSKGNESDEEEIEYKPTNVLRVPIVHNKKPKKKKV
uniref:Uncharacterized protein n=1 Tax=Lepeophtheirus salmonis TaxID=72036 RepID=A0A0K2TTU3_LEPSM